MIIKPFYNPKIAPNGTVGLNITGSPVVAGELTAFYNYVGTETVQWYRADDQAGTNKVSISGAKYKIYNPNLSDVGKYIQVGVTSGGETLSTYTAVVTKTVIMEDYFNYGNIDIGKWTVTQSTQTITQTYGALSIVGSGVVSSYTNKVVSILSGNIVQARLMKTNVANDCVPVFALEFDSSNRIEIRGVIGSTAARIVVTLAGVETDDSGSVSSFSGAWKIKYLSGVVTVSQLNDSTDSWTVVATYNRTFAGNGYAVATMQTTSTSATFYFNDFVMSSSDYTSYRPDRFYPPTQSNDRLNFLTNKKIGWFFHNIYYPVYLNQPGYDDWSDPRSCMYLNYAWDTFAQSALDGGRCEYAIIQAKLEVGMRLWDTSSIPKYNNGSSHAYDGTTVPQWGFDYDIIHPDLVTAGVNASHLQNGIDAFTSRGIPVGLYYASSWDLNYRGNNYVSVSHTSTDPLIYQRYDEYMALAEREILHLLDTHTNVRFLWLDNFGRYPWINSINQSYRNLNSWRLYQKIRERHSSIIIIGNLSANSTSLYSSNSILTFPTDIGSVEYNVKPPSDSEISSDFSAFKGISYYNPKELVYTGLYSDTNTYQYVWDVRPPGPGNSYNNIRDQSTFQTRYDYAKGLGVPFSVNIPVANDGTISSPGTTTFISSTYLNRVNGIIL